MLIERLENIPQHRKRPELVLVANRGGLVPRLPNPNPFRWLTFAVCLLRPRRWVWVWVTGVGVDRSWWVSCECERTTTREWALGRSGRKSCSHTTTKA